MITAAPHDYSFLLQAPGQLEELFKSMKVTLAHPVCQLPSAAWVVALLRQPDGRNRLLQKLEERETLIKLMEKDPLQYGYEPMPPLCTRRCWDDARRLMNSHRGPDANCAKEREFSGKQNNEGNTNGLKLTINDARRQDGEARVGEVSSGEGIQIGNDREDNLDQHGNIRGGVSGNEHDADSRNERGSDRIIPPSPRSFTILHITSRNRNTKTEFAAKEVVRVAELGGKVIWCLCETHETSTRAGGQQEVVWKYFPPRWKALNGKTKGHATWKVSYSAGNRFAENSVLVPTPQPGKPNLTSEIRFMYYAQGIKIIEGGAIDLFWGDEDMPADWVKTMKFRLLDRHGAGVLTFTPVNGWNDTYGLFYQGAEVREWQDFPLHKEKKHWAGGLPGKIPYLVQPIEKNYAAMFFPPDANPYIPFADIVQSVENEGYEQQMIRLAGIAQNKVGNLFPKFGKPLILPAAQIPKTGTRYHFIDFAPGRNWFQFWVLVSQPAGSKRRIFIYREWPDKRTYAEWALPGGKNGVRGPAQDEIGLGYESYRDLILGLEGNKEAAARAKLIGYTLPEVPEVIETRFGDPRSGRMPVITHDGGGTCNFDEMAKVDMEMEPAKGLLIGDGLGNLKELMDYDQEAYVRAGGFTPLNHPQFFISEECEQTIECLGLWKNQGSEREQASKDPIDLLRYMATEDLQDTGGRVFQCRGGGAY